ncbi:MAG TPA: hypothetical protein VLM80_09545, partial [Anaerolineales bacterium]|nr:hypothetical protein [Anaerolineales bacterium]
PRRNNRVLYERLDLINSKLAETEKQQKRLLDLYLTGDFTKEDLSESKNHLDSTVNELRKERAQLTDHLERLTYSDADIETIEDFCSKINHNLDNITYEGKKTNYRYARRPWYTSDRK